MSIEVRTNSIGMKFVLVRAGRFLMGSTNTEPGRDSDEGPQHVVHLTKDFWIGAHPVTQAQYAALGFENFSKFPGPNHPVEMLDLLEMNRFLERLSEKDDIRY